MTVAETILEHLGGKKFIAMTGAKNFVSYPDSLAFRIPKSNRGIERVKVFFFNDTYTISFFTAKGKYITQRADAHADYLKPAFERETGLRISLEHVYN